jgi:penicillin-binding protein 2
VHKRRISILFGIIAAIFSVVVLRLGFLQIVRGEHYARYADRQRIALLPRSPARARILTRDGRVLAQDRLAFDVAVVIGRLDPARERRLRDPLRSLFYVPRRETLLRITDFDCEVRRDEPDGRLFVRAWSKLEVEARDEHDVPVVYLVDRETHWFPVPEHLLGSLERLARLTGERRDDLLRNVLDAALDVARLRVPVFAEVPVIKDVDYDVVAAVEAHPRQFRGFQVRVRFDRENPGRPIAPHLVGRVGPFSPADVEAAVEQYHGWPGRGYFMHRRIGRSGIEKSADGWLRGEFGMECIERDHLNRRQRVLTDAPATPGRDVVLTLDSRLQALIEEAMGDTVGAAVFLDVRTGHILAIASGPRFDPGVFDDRAAYRALLEDPRRPLVDRALLGRYPLGSVFKVVTALAALEKGCAPGSVHCHGSIRVGRRTFHCHRRYGHGRMDLTDGIKYSCNVYFYRTGQAVGGTALIAMARRLGFGRKTGLRVPAEAAGNLPYTARGGELANLSIGQGKLVVTPLQVAQMMATVANDGVRMPARIVAELRPFDIDSPAAELPPDARRPADLDLSKRAVDAVRLGLYKVVNEHGGTGRRAFARFERPFKVCGKTSTAQRRVRRDGRVVPDNVGWFAGFAPHDKPRIAFAVCVEHLTGDEGGGTTAAPIARQVLDTIPLDLLGVDASEGGGR